MPPSTLQDSSTLSLSFSPDKTSEVAEDMEAIWLHDDSPPPSDHSMIIDVRGSLIVRDPFQRLSVGSHECSGACLEVHRRLRIKCLSLIISCRISSSMGGCEDGWFAIKSPVIGSLIPGGSVDLDSILEPVHVQFIDSAREEVVEQWSLTFDPSDTHTELDDAHQRGVVLLRCLQAHLTVSPAPTPKLS